jgi:competence protein ComEA
MLVANGHLCQPQGCPILQEESMKLLAWMMTLLLSTQLFAAVNLNTATAEELAQLQGIGEATAKKILEYREKHGFQDIRELVNIKGIGEKKFASIKDELTL